MTNVVIIMPKRKNIAIREGTVPNLGMSIGYPDSHTADALKYGQNNL
jgi:hypothetical protein